MPALFWLVVVALALGVGAAAAWPYLQERAGDPGRPGEPGSRSPWLVPMGIMVAGFIVAMIVSFLFPSFPVFLLFLPFVWWQRRRRGPRPPTPPG